MGSSWDFKILEARDVTVGYGGIEILSGISFSLPRGKRVLLAGGNGTGKSTLLKSIVGLVRPWKGSILLDGQNITKLPTHRIVNMGIRMLKQDFNVLPNLTVFQNLAVAGGEPEKLEEMGISLPLDRLAANLSGGQRQALALAMALSGQTHFLLLDEPTAGISPIERGSYSVGALLKTIDQAWRREGFGMIIVEHNIRLAINMVDEVWIVKNGRLLTGFVPQELKKMRKEEIFKLIFF